MAEAVWNPGALPVAARGHNSVGWWGVLCLIATEASLFAYLLFSYFYFSAQHTKAWLPETHPSLALAGPNTAILLLSSVAVWWGERGVTRGRRGQHLAGLAVAIALGIIFLIVQAFEWKAKSFSLSSSAYGSFYFTITGFHMAHVVVGVALLTAVFGWSLAGYYSPRRHDPVMITAVYWHFVDVVWLAVFFTFYITPYLW